MIRSKLTAIAAAALAGAALCTIPLQSASAFTLSAPSPAAADVSGQIDKVQWRHGGGWRGGGWHGGGWRRGGGGWVPGAIIGGLALGALGAGYYGGYYGPYGPAYGGDCWRDGWGRVRCY